MQKNKIREECIWYNNHNHIPMKLNMNLKTKIKLLTALLKNKYFRRRNHWLTHINLWSLLRWAYENR